MKQKNELQTAGTTQEIFFDNYNRLLKEKNVFMMTTIILAVAAVFYTFGLIYAVSLPKEKYHIIEISSWGEPKYQGTDITVNSLTTIARSKTVIDYFLRNFIEKSRTISVDNDINRTNYRECFSFVTQKASGFLQTMLNENMPFSRMKEEKVEIAIKAIFHIENENYQVDWMEVSRNLGGEEEQQNQYRGIFNLYFTPPVTEIQRIKNPLGMFVDGFDIKQIK